MDYITVGKNCLLTKWPKCGIIQLVKNTKGGEIMWSEMSYNRFNLTFLEKLENAPDSDEDVFSYYFSERMVVNEYIDKVTRGELDWD